MKPVVKALNAEAQVPPPSLYKVYEHAEDIQYAPEDALKEGIAMVKALKASIKNVDLGSKLRHDVWQDEIRKYVRISLLQEREC